MKKKSCSYLKLSHNAQQGIYYDKTPQKVLTAQDPNNPLSYQIQLETVLIQKPNPQNAILENYINNYK